MKRIAYLALPLLLCALVWGVKWRADHPTPTKLDLEVRALMLKASQVEVGLTRHRINPNSRSLKAALSKEEARALVESFNLSPQPNQLSDSSSGIKGRLVIEFHSPEKKSVAGSVKVQADIDEREGTAFIRTGNGHRIYALHVVTNRRWKQLLLNHPRIGPELRRRMNQ